MRSSFLKALMVALVSLASTQPALADDDEDERRRGPKTKFENNSEQYKYEYKDRHCKYKYEYKYRTGKTKVEQKGDCRHIAIARPVAHGEPFPRAIPPEPDAKTITCNREVVGAIIGGVIGAGVGSRVGDRRRRPIAVAGGAVIGAVVGGAIGRSMDEADQVCAAQALEYADLKQSVTWRNPARGTSYTITPTENVRSRTHGDCRKYVLRTVAGGEQRNSAGTACWQSNGSWTLVN